MFSGGQEFTPINTQLCASQQGQALTDCNDAMFLYENAVMDYCFANQSVDFCQVPEGAQMPSMPDSYSALPDEVKSAMSGPDYVGGLFGWDEARVAVVYDSIMAGNGIPSEEAPAPAPTPAPAATAQVEEAAEEESDEADEGAEGNAFRGHHWLNMLGVNMVTFGDYCTQGGDWPNTFGDPDINSAHTCMALQIGLYSAYSGHFKLAESHSWGLNAGLELGYGYPKLRLNVEGSNEPRDGHLMDLLARIETGPAFLVKDKGPAISIMPKVIAAFGYRWGVGDGGIVTPTSGPITDFGHGMLRLGLGLDVLFSVAEKVSLMVGLGYTYDISDVGHYERTSIDGEARDYIYFTPHTFNLSFGVLAF